MVYNQEQSYHCIGDITNQTNILTVLNQTWNFEHIAHNHKLLMHVFLLCNMNIACVVLIVHKCAKLDDTAFSKQNCIMENCLYEISCNIQNNFQQTSASSAHIHIFLQTPEYQTWENFLSKFNVGLP